MRQDELYSLMDSILDWAISLLGESTQGTIRAIYFEGKTVKQHSEEEYVTEYAIYKRLKRSYPVIKEVVLEEHRLGDVDRDLLRRVVEKVLVHEGPHLEVVMR